jgi:predicted nucleotidyltransferase
MLGTIWSCDMTTVQLVRSRRGELLRIAARHGARDVRVFGSVARGEADDASDVDFLVEMEPGRSLLDLGALQAPF